MTGKAGAERRRASRRRSKRSSRAPTSTRSRRPGTRCRRPVARRGRMQRGRTRRRASWRRSRRSSRDTTERVSVHLSLETCFLCTFHACYCVVFCSSKVEVAACKRASCFQECRVQVGLS
uniref:Uncharacterized protein n=1 Tax=Arundo donax TaxID=35708 RepID=A0A0A9C1D7_ARUDO